MLQAEHTFTMFRLFFEITCKDVPQEIMDDILNILLEEKQIVKINDEMTGENK